MVSKCPWCNKFNKSSYQGVFCEDKPYYKIFKCEESKCKRYYTIEIIKGKKRKEKEDKEKKKEEKKKEERREEKLQRRREIDFFLNKRTACPLCTKLKGNEKYKGSLRELLKNDSNFEYKYVVYMGELHKTEKNKFYCNNHSTTPFKKKYQFTTNISEKNIMGLGRFITESSSQHFYNKVRKIYKEGKGKYPFKEDPKNILSSLYSLGIPQTLLAKIFHTSQPTIYRLIERKMFSEPLHTIYIEKKHSALFYTQIKISENDLTELKQRWKKNTLNP